MCCTIAHSRFLDRKHCCTIARFRYMDINKCSAVVQQKSEPVILLTRFEGWVTEAVIGRSTQQVNLCVYLLNLKVGLQERKSVALLHPLGEQNSLFATWGSKA